MLRFIESDVMLQRSRTRRLIHTHAAVACTAALLPGTFFTATPAAAQELQAAASEGAVSIPPDQLDSLVSPVARTRTRCLLRCLRRQPIRWSSSSCISGCRRIQA